MSETTNYGLYIEGDSTTKVKQWREKMNGLTDSNMTKIDEILFDKADKSTTITATLSHQNWQGTVAPYTYELAVEGLKAGQNGYINLAHDVSFEARQVARDAQLCVTGQADGVLTISADGEPPDLDLKVTILFLN